MVGPGGFQMLGWHDRNPAAGQQVDLLVRADIGDKGNLVGGDPAEVQQGIALCGGTIGCDLFSVTGGLFQEGAQSLANRLHAWLEAGIGFDPVKPGCTFRSTDGLKARAFPAIRAIGATGKDAQTAAMGRQFLDVEKLQSVARKDTLDHQKREVRIMLVIDGVELHILDQAQQMREFHGQHAIFGEQDRQS